MHNISMLNNTEIQVQSFNQNDGINVMSNLLKTSKLPLIAFIAALGVGCGDSGNSNSRIGASPDTSGPSAGNNGNLVDGEAGPASLEFNKVSADAIYPGDPIVFAWNSTNTTGCSASTSGSVNTDTEWAGTLEPTGQKEVEVPDSPGTYIYTLTCGEAPTGKAESISVNVLPKLVPGPGPEIVFSPPAPSGEQVAGEPITIAWTTEPDTAQCTGVSLPPSDAWDRTFTDDKSATITPEQPGNYAYNLACKNEEGAQTVENILFSVKAADPAVDMAFTGGATNLAISVGQSAAFSWDVDTSAVECVAKSAEDSRWGPQFATAFESAISGSYIASGLDTGIYNYSLSCTDRSGNTGTPASVRLIVGSIPAPSGEFEPEIPVIDENSNAGIDWTAEDADQCVTYSQTWPEWRDAALENDGLSGLADIALPELTDGTNQLDATLICSNAKNGQGSLSKAFKVESTTSEDGEIIRTPVAPAATLSASPSKVATGGELTLNWNADSAASCAIPSSVGGNWNAGEIDLNGSVTVNAPDEPGIYTYSVACEAASPSEKVQVDVYVTVGNVTPVITRFDTPISQVRSGDSITLTWSAENALYCESGSSGVEGWAGMFEHSANGSKEVTLPRNAYNSNYDFALKCGIPGGPEASEITSVTTKSIGNECGVVSDNKISRLLSNDLVGIQIGSIFSSTGSATVIEDKGNIIDSSLQTYGRVTVPLGLLGLINGYIDVYARPPLKSLDALTSDMGNNKEIGFIIGNPNQALQASVLGLDSLSQIVDVVGQEDGSVAVTTGTADYSNTNGLTLNALFLVNDIQASYVSMPIDEGETLAGVRYDIQGGLLSLAKILDFYGACISSDRPQ